MFRSLFGFDWRKSPAHLFLLSRFLTPRTIEDFSKSGNWKATLKEDPQKAIKRFLDEDMVEQANLSNILNSKYTLSNLKTMLRQRGLPISGR